MSAADSLNLADMVELLKGGVSSSHPMCPKARMVLRPGFDRGNPVPETSVVASLLTDGETPKGRRAGNRTITLPVMVYAPDRPTLNGAVELLLRLVDQPKFSLTWTPDPADGDYMPMIFDCFRTTGSTHEYDQDSEDELVAKVTLVFPAHPYGRSAQFTTIPFPTPSVGITPPAPAIRLDDLTSVGSSTQAPWWSQSPQHIYDSFSARWSFSASDGASAPTYTATLGAAVNLTGLDKLTFGFGMGTANYQNWRAGQVTFAITLKDNSGRVLSFGDHVQASASNDPDFPIWNPVTFAIPPSLTFDFAHVTGYSIKAWRQIHWLGFLYHDADCFLNGITAVASVGVPIAAVRGTVYKFGAPGGTARAPMFAEFQAPPPAGSPTTTTSYTIPGVYAFIPPVGAETLKVRVKAASGKGGDRTTAGAAAGAGGGATVAHDAYPCTEGQPITVVVGAAGSSGGFPVLTTSYFDNEDSYTGNTLSTPSFTPAPGEVLVVKAIASDSSSSFGSAPRGGGLTWTSRVNIGPGGFSRVQVWTAVAGASPGPMTVQLAAPSSGSVFWFLAYAMTVERWAGAVLAGSPATVSGSGSGTAPSATCTTAQSNSVVSWASSDWNASSAARTYRSSAAEERYNFASSRYTGYWATQQAASAGAQTVGLTAPASQQWTLAGIEIEAAVTGALTDGQPSTFDNATGGGFVAAGGKSVPPNTNVAGLGGTVAACTVPAGGTAYRGGNGAAGSATGGGAGSGAGDNAAGTDATAQAGAVAPAGGGNGGAGGNAGGNNPGGAGAAPAGAGGGAFSTGGAAAGGAGAAGRVDVTYPTPVSPFKVLLAHSPGFDAPATLNPLMPVGAGLDPPDGREYAIASPVAGLSARFRGTYTPVVFASTVISPGSVRTITVTFKQYDYPGGPSTSVSTSRTLTPNSESPPIANGVIILPEVTLPVRDIADDQTAAFTTVAITSTLADRFLDVAACDVAGQTLLVSVASGTGYPTFYYDAPDIDKDWGRVLGSAFGRPQAVSALDSVLRMTGGPLLIDPDGPGWLLAYSPDAGAPSLDAGFWARWRDTRLT